MKQYKVLNLAPFVGYEADPPLVLWSGRKVSTVTWNPFIFSLVLGRPELYNFIYKELNFNLKKMMELTFDHQSGEYRQSEDRETEGIFETLKLMVENNS
jgi:hypothetical protein